MSINNAELHNRAISDQMILDILGNLQTQLAHPGSPIEKEFTKFIDYWLRQRMKSDALQGIKKISSQNVQDILSISTTNEEDRESVRLLIQEEVIHMRDALRTILKDEICTIYDRCSGEDKKFIDSLLQNNTINKVIPMGMLLLLDYVKQSNSDKRAQWISKAFDYARNISRSVETVESKIKDHRIKEIVFSEFRRMYQETFATIAATGCHIYSEDCSVLMQSVKIQCGKSSGISVESGIQNILDIIQKGKVAQSRKFFPGLEEFLQKKRVQDTLRNEEFLYIPVIVDAKDILLYLRIMSHFFESWALSFQKKNLYFRVSISTFEFAKSKGTQPRIKFCYKDVKSSAEEFNIRLDYVKGNIEIDIGTIGIGLQNGGTLFDYLTLQALKPIDKNSYVMGRNMNTERIMEHPMLCIGEQMALTHSAMMQQGCDVLGRDESKIFAYHYKLINTVGKEEFQNVQEIFGSKTKK